MDIEKHAAGEGTLLSDIKADTTIVVQETFSKSHDLLPSSNDDIEDEDDTPLLNEESNGDHLPAFKLSQFLRLVFLVGFSVLVLVAVLAAFLFALASPQDGNLLSSHWQGFEHIENYFPFGDSWTDVSFWPPGAQPSEENPIGNPAFPGQTSSNGINYVGYLTAKYNQSFIRTYNFGFSGSTVDTNVVQGYFAWNDFTHRVAEFAKHYTINGSEPKGWRPNNTLFSVFFGVNDFATFNKFEHTLEQWIDAYETDILRLYDLSARNFVVFNVPPIDKSPLWKVHLHNGSVPVEDFNKHVRTMIRSLRRKHNDINIFEYDVHKLMSRVITNPQSVSYTSRYKNVTGYCDQYDLFGTWNVSTRDQVRSCGGLEPHDFLWLNSLHVTQPIHQAMAAEVADLLMRQ